MGPEANILSPPPLHPSLMALDDESHFSEAAFLIDMLCVMSSDQPVPTPGLDNVEVTSNNNHRRALYHLIEWAYSREYLNILSFCHDRYLSLCSDSLRFRDSNYPIFLAAVSDKRLNVLEMVFNHQDKRPLPDRILSRPYSLVKNKDLPKASAIGVAATKCLEGRPDILNTMLAHQILGNHLVNISLSELDFTQVPIEIFHVNLKSLTLSNNQLTILPPVENWKCSKLSFLNISSNLFTELPPGIFSLAKLISLDASNNRIQHLDVSMWSSPSLKSLYLSSNQIESLPVPNLDPYQISLQMQNFTSPVGSERETWNSVRQSFIDFSSEREEDYHLMDSGHRLEFLDLSNNRLKSVPSGLPCLAPMLLTLKLNKNQIEDFKCFNDYPTLLKSLDLSNNIATQSIICKEGSPGLASFCLQSKPGQITRCVHIFHWRLANLQYLNYSFNRLRKVMVESKMGDALGLNFTQSTLTSDTNSLFPKLHSLYLNNNRLTAMPQGIHNLEHLGTLDVRDNPEITELPSKLHHLKNLIGFQYRGIGDPIIATLDTFKDTAQVLYYLRARETE
jgi:Leucine-rich repeat (LRR) protein